MDPSVYIPAYLERAYVASHPKLTDAARELVHNDVSVNPHKYAQTEHAQALLSYAASTATCSTSSIASKTWAATRSLSRRATACLTICAMSCSRSSAPMRMSSMPSCSPSFGGHARRRLPGRLDEARGNHSRLPAAKRARIRHGGSALLGQQGAGRRRDCGRSHRKRAGSYRVAPHARGHLAAVHGERSLPCCRQLFSSCS